MTSPNDQDPFTDPRVEAPAPSSAGPSRLRVGVIGGAALALAIGAVATSLAASPATTAPLGTTTIAGGDAPAQFAVPGVGALDDAFDHGRMGDHGFRDITIASISGSNVSLKTDDGWSRTIAVTSSVTLTKGGQTIAVSGLAVGDQVRIGQTRNDDGTYTVTEIAVVVPSVHGTVSGVTSSGFKITNRDGSVWTISVNGSTKFQYGTGTGSLADVANGTEVLVLGSRTGDNALTALTVRVAPDQAVGTVKSKTSDTIVITQGDGSTLTIHVDGDTTYRVAGVDTAKLSDVAVDMAIGVSGRARADGSIDADTVMAGSGGTFRGGGDGFFGGGGRGGHGGPGGFGPGMGGLDDTAPLASPTTSS